MTVAGSTNRAAAERLYAAFEARDPQAILGVLQPDFRGEVSAGMPSGWGGVYEGAEAMLRNCWGPVFTELDTRPVPAEYLETADGRIVVVGHYVGVHRETKRPHRAAFAHVLRFRDGRIAELV
jgi:uncharacterized protein